MAHCKADISPLQKRHIGPILGLLQLGAGPYRASPIGHDKEMAGVKIFNEC